MLYVSWVVRPIIQMKGTSAVAEAGRSGDIARSLQSIFKVMQGCIARSSRKSTAGRSRCARWKGRSLTCQIRSAPRRPTPTNGTSPSPQPSPKRATQKTHETERAALPSTIMKRPFFRPCGRWGYPIASSSGVVLFLSSSHQAASRQKPPSAAVELELNTTPRLAWQTAHPAHGSSKECCAMEASLLVIGCSGP